MATLNSLQLKLRQAATCEPSQQQQLSPSQYDQGFKILTHDSGWEIYQKFIIPQLLRVFSSLLVSEEQVSVLEVGPGPSSVLCHLPGHQRGKIKRYAAFEPNSLYASKLKKSLLPGCKSQSPFPALECRPSICQAAFTLGAAENEANISSHCGSQQFNIVLFCHSMYGMSPKSRYIERALEMLTDKPGLGFVMVFHRDGSLNAQGLVCHETASYPQGQVQVADDDQALDSFAAFIAGFVVQDPKVDLTIRTTWRQICRTIGRREETSPHFLFFSAPNVMVSFTRHATSLPELTAQVPLISQGYTVKNREARLNHPAVVVKPTEIRHVQQCVQWALKHRVSLTVVGGGHSGHCLLSNVVALDLSAFDQVHIREIEGSRHVAVVEVGCKTGTIIRKTMDTGFTVPLGSRPSVGAGLWLQGGIGHLARLHGLACDAIIGAVIVSVETGQILHIGKVPVQNQPIGSARPENEDDLLWALKGAGTNFGIVISVTFTLQKAPMYRVRSWIVPCEDLAEARLRFAGFSSLAKALPKNQSADLYVFSDKGLLRLGITTIEHSVDGFDSKTPARLVSFLGPEARSQIVDGLGLFETEIYMGEMHGGHGGGKTSSFKRCVFLKDVRDKDIMSRLIAAIEGRPTPLCYLHLLHGGGAVTDVPARATAFGCRSWTFACVITGVWPRHQDDSRFSQSAVDWVYSVVHSLSLLGCGIYGADLGPDPRDAELATKAFGPNRHRLARLKQQLDPFRILAYTCPLGEPPAGPKVILLVTGESCAGKDHTASLWVSMFTEKFGDLFKVQLASISDATKREYAAAAGADLDRLLHDRVYKEDHRSKLTRFYGDQVKSRPKLPEEHFIAVVRDGSAADLLLITGMRDEAPVAIFSHLVPQSKLIEVHVEASATVRRLRGGFRGKKPAQNNGGFNNNSRTRVRDFNSCLVFENDKDGGDGAKKFFERHLCHLLHEDLQQLRDMIRLTADFPRQGIEFHHVLGLSQVPGGLSLCTTLFVTHFNGDWQNVNKIVCCEAGGFIFASALASKLGIPLVLVREAGKLPPPTVSVAKKPSNITSLAVDGVKEKRIEMERGVIVGGESVVVVDDVLATGETLGAVLQLLVKAGIETRNISAMTVGEFPAHRGRELLHQRGFGLVGIQSLIVFGGF